VATQGRTTNVMMVTTYRKGNSGGQQAMNAVMYRNY
jgi:hypothetical protein